MRIILLVCLFTISITGCSGYKFKNSDNPFEQYNIRHLSVPMFVNHSNLVNVSTQFSNKFLMFLTEFKGLHVTSGESDKSDAILLGIVESPRNLQETTRVNSTLFTQEDLETSIGNRSKLYVPKSTAVTIYLRLILIKKHSKSAEENNIRTVIFDQRFPLKDSFGRIIAETATDNSPGLVNFTKNRKNLYSTIDILSDEAVDKFRDLIINVF